jgi:diguanylate cyclase (GGDEF)-like protein/PAS domain S-box-containing protein
MWAEDHAQQLEQRFARVFQSNPAALVITRLVDGKFLAVNASFEELLGWTRDQLLGRTPFDFDAYGGAANRQEIVRQLRETGTVREFGTQMRAASGDLRDVLASMQLIDFGSEAAVLAAVIDVTDRRAAERALRRRETELAFLAEASAVLASSLDYDRTLQAVAELAASRLATWCAFHIVDAGGRLRELTIAHADPAMAEQACGLLDLCPPESSGISSILRVVSTGRSEIFGDVSDAMLEATARDARHLAQLRALQLRSIIIAPLIAREQVLGTLTLVTSRASRELDGSDLVLAQDLAHRAAIAVDNARLFTGASENERRFRALFDQAAVGVAQSDLQGRWLLVNQRIIDLYGYSWTELSGLRFHDITHPDDLAVDLAQFERLMSGEIPSYALEKRFIRKDGSTVWAQVTISLIRDEHGEPRYTIAVVEDVSERKRGEEALRRSEARYRQMFAGNQAVKLLVDPNGGRIVDANPAACAYYGSTFDQLTGKTIAAISTAPMEDIQRQMERDRCGQTPVLFARHRLASGEERDVEIYSSPIEVDGQVYLYSIVHDVTERKRAEAALTHQALHDGLTGLPNRTLLQDRLEQAIHRGRRQAASVALLLIDLDRFKEINDTFGHGAGDSLLRELGPRLQQLLRESDTVARPTQEGEMESELARLGGDEFAILLPETDAGGASVVADRILDQLSQPFLIEGQAVTIGASIGIAVSPEHGETADLLLRHADVAMYSAKKAHSGSALYDADEDPYTATRLTLIADLGRAIAADELLLYYQPLVDISTRRVLGAEALVRWQHREHGFIPPSQIIDMAEHAELIKPLTLWVLSAALRDCRGWRDAGWPLSVAVNLSARSLHDYQLPRLVGDALDAAGLPAAALTIEITETAMVIDPRRASAIIGQLNAMGVAVSIDDFGMGYSSLSYLKTLPAREVKIDRSFVFEMVQRSEDWRIVRAAITLAHDLGLRAVAEGIESEETWEALRQLECDAGQGYYFARPMPLCAFVDWLAAARDR